MFNGMMLSDGFDPFTGMPVPVGPTPIDTSVPSYQGGYDLPGTDLTGYTQSGGGYGGGGSTITPIGTSADSWTTLFSNFPKFAGGIATIVSAVGGRPYAQGPYGASGGYGANPYGSSPLGVSGGISTTTLLLIAAAAFFLLRK
jgi:hypothetical protein